MRSARAVAVRAIMLALAAAAAAWALSHFGAVYVKGASMSPTLLRGDLAIVRKDVSGIREGDVVLVTKPAWPEGVLHRVESITLDDRLVLRGDANPVPDLEPSPMGDVRGVMVLDVPLGRMFLVVEALARMVQSRVT
jgi:signal peptidase I